MNMYFPLTRNSKISKALLLLRIHTPLSLWCSSGMQLFTMHTYSETPLFSCLTILCPFRSPSSTRLGCWPWLHCFLAWPYTHPANSSYREICMDGKNMARASSREWEDRRWKKDLTGVCSFVKTAETGQCTTVSKTQKTHSSWTAGTFTFCRWSSPPLVHPLSSPNPLLFSERLHHLFTRTMVTERGKDTAPLPVTSMEQGLAAFLAGWKQCYRETICFI